MAGSRCLVSFTDSEGVLHGVDVDAESLYEAVAIAVAQMREDEVSPSAPPPTTEFTVTVYRNPVEHKIRLQQCRSGQTRRRRRDRRGLRSGRGGARGSDIRPNTTVSFFTFTNLAVVR